MTKPNTKSAADAAVDAAMDSAREQDAAFVAAASAQAQAYIDASVAKEAALASTALLLRDNMGFVLTGLDGDVTSLTLAQLAERRVWDKGILPAIRTQIFGMAEDAHKKDCNSADTLAKDAYDIAHTLATVAGGMGAKLDGVAIVGVPLAAVAVLVDDKGNPTPKATKLGEAVVAARADMGETITLDDAIASLPAIPVTVGDVKRPAHNIVGPIAGISDTVTDCRNVSVANKTRPAPKRNEASKGSTGSRNWDRSANVVINGIKGDQRRAPTTVNMPDETRDLLCDVGAAVASFLTSKHGLKGEGMGNKAQREALNCFVRALEYQGFSVKYPVTD